MEADNYITPRIKGVATFKERGSKFIGIAFYAPTVDAAMDGLESIKKEYWDATHHCYAYQTGTDDQEWRANDDGEPSGSAGRPIHGQIRSSGLTHIMVVVVRYYGGTKLGVPGLIKSYKEAAALAIAEAGIKKRTRSGRLSIEFKYSATSEVQRIISQENAIIAEQSFTEVTSLTVEVKKSRINSFMEKFALLEEVTVKELTEDS